MYIKGCKNNNVDINIANKLYDLMLTSFLKEDIKKLIIYYQLKNYDLLYKNNN